MQPSLRLFFKMLQFRMVEENIFVMFIKYIKMLINFYSDYQYKSKFLATNIQKSNKKIERANKIINSTSNSSKAGIINFIK